MSVREDTIVGEGTKIWHPELSNIYGPTIGKNCNIGALVEIRADVVIGDECKIQAFTRFSIKIFKYKMSVIISRFVSVDLII